MDIQLFENKVSLAISHMKPIPRLPFKHCKNNNARRQNVEFRRTVRKIINTDETVRGIYSQANGCLDILLKC